MNSGKTPESGFIGQRRRLPRGRDDDDDDFGRDRGNNASGFIGSSNARLGRDETGFEGLEGRNEDPRDFAPIGNSYPNERGNGSRDSLSFENSHKKRAKPAQKTEKPLTHIDRNTVGKVVELKDKYQRLKDRSNDKDKEMKVTDMKIDALAERIREIDKKKAEFKDQLFEEKKKNNLLKKRLDLNEQEKLDLEQQLETGIKPNRKGKKGKGIFGNVDIEGHQQMLEERRRKEREEMRRQLFAGVDFLGGGQLKVNQSTSRKCWETVRYKVLNFFDTITPHKTDLKYISAKYDKATTAFFQFYRFVVAFSIILFVFFLLILTLHTVDYYANNSFTSPEYCNNIP